MMFFFPVVVSILSSLPSFDTLGQVTDVQHENNLCQLSSKVSFGTRKRKETNRKNLVNQETDVKTI